MMKWAAIAVLTLAILFWNQAPTYTVALRFVVGLGALLVASQALRAGKKGWAVAFYAVAVVFNPFVAFIGLAGKLAVFAVLATILLFAAAIAALKTQPLLSVASITDRTPGSESL